MIRGITDERKRRSITMSAAVYTLIFAFVFQVSSFHDLQFWLERSNARFSHLFRKGTRLPKTDALRDILKRMHLCDVKNMFESIVDKLVENKVLRQNTINGFRVAAVDGVEVFSSRLKSCPHCLTRTVGEETEYFHKAVACMTVGNDPHIVLGMEMLKPRDGGNKDEGEMTGVKRLLTELRTRHHHFADVIVADALYMNAPFINLVKGIGMDVVIRAKNEKMSIVQDARGLFKNREANGSFNDTKKEVEVWDEDGFSMEGAHENIRFLRFVEHWQTKDKKLMKREMWCITTLGKEIPAHTVWLIMRKRWDIENNGFRMLKTYFHADHCYVHGEGADEKVLMFIMMAFNLWELFLFRRLKKFREQKLTRKHFIEQLWDELLIEDYSKYYESG